MTVRIKLALATAFILIISAVTFSFISRIQRDTTAETPIDFIVDDPPVQPPPPPAAPVKPLIPIVFSGGPTSGKNNIVSILEAGSRGRRALAAGSMARDRRDGSVCYGYFETTNNRYVSLSASGDRDTYEMMFNAIGQARVMIVSMSNEGDVNVANDHIAGAKSMGIDKIIAAVNVGQCPSIDQETETPTETPGFLTRTAQVFFDLKDRLMKYLDSDIGFDPEDVTQGVNTIQLIQKSVLFVPVCGIDPMTTAQSGENNIIERARSLIWWSGVSINDLQNKPQRLYTIAQILDSTFISIKRETTSHTTNRKEFSISRIDIPATLNQAAITTPNLAHLQVTVFGRVLSGSLRQGDQLKLSLASLSPQNPECSITVHRLEVIGDTILEAGKGDLVAMQLRLSASCFRTLRPRGGNGIILSLPNHFYITPNGQQGHFYLRFDIGHVLVQTEDEAAIDGSVSDGTTFPTSQVPSSVEGLTITTRSTVYVPRIGDSDMMLEVQGNYYKVKRITDSIDIGSKAADALGAAADNPILTEARQLIRSTEVYDQSAYNPGYPSTRRSPAEFRSRHRLMPGVAVGDIFDAFIAGGSNICQVMKIAWSETRINPLRNRLANPAYTGNYDEAEISFVCKKNFLFRPIVIKIQPGLAGLRKRRVSSDSQSSVIMFQRLPHHREGLAIPAVNDLRANASTRIVALAGVITSADPV